MKKIVLLFVAVLLFSLNGFSQLSGVKTIPGDYPTIASAIADLNAVGIESPGVTFEVAAGHTETFASSSAGLITATGTSLDNQIIFEKSGEGANPLITAATGVSTTVDGIIVIKGGDYITFDGIDLQENAANTTATMRMEWGYAFVKASATNGAQNNNIMNCAITLNKTNTNSVGIYSGNHTELNTTALTITALSGANSYNKVNGNTISNVFYGIYFKGYTDSSPYANYDQGVEIGMTDGNNISNFGGSSTCAGIYIMNNNLAKVSNNTISTSTNNTLRGIYLASTTNANVDVTFNTIALTSTGTTTLVVGIESAISGTSNIVNLNNNTIENCSYATATTGNFYGIYNNAAAFNVNINENTVANNTLSGSGTFYGIETGSPTTCFVNDNSIANNIKSGVSGTLYCIKTTSPATLTVDGNTIDGNSITGTAATGSIYGFYSNSSALTITVSNNVIKNLTVNGNGSIYGALDYGSSAAKTFTANQIFNFSTTGAAGTMYGIKISTGTINKVSHNAIYGFTSIGGTSGSFYGIQASGGTTNNIFNNVISSILTTSSNPSLYGIYLSGGTTNNVYNNAITDLQTPNANAAIPLAGIYASSGAANLYYNTIYLNANSVGALFGSAGIYTSTTPAVNMKNNIIVNTSTPAGATGYTSAFRRSSTTLTTYSGNNNCFYAGTPGANNVIFYDGTASYLMSPYQALVGGTKDNLSFEEMPPFVNVTTMPYDLRLQTTVSTKCESGGERITSPAITTDAEGTIRWGEDGYTGTGSTTDVGADEFEGIPSYTCTVPVPGNTLSSSASMCYGQSITLSMQNATPGTGVNYQWQTSPDGVAAYSDIVGATTATYSTIATTEAFYQCVVTCQNGPATAISTPIGLAFANTVTGTTPGTRCGTGNVSLAATTGSGTLAWYAASTGGVSLGTGSPFMTPIISTTTDFYVGAEAPAEVDAGRLAPTSLRSDFWANYGLVFNASSSILLKTVDVYPVNTAPANITIRLLDNAGNQVVGTSDVVFMPISGTGSTAQTITLNFNIPAGIGYRLVALSGVVSANKLIQENVDFTYPIINGDISIISNWNGSIASTTYYSWFYNWKVTGSCSSPRVAVTATVTTPPAFAITENQTLCNDAVGTLTVTSTLSDFDTYTWTPQTNLFTDISCTTPYAAAANASTVYVKSATPGVTIYTCTANNSVSLCANTATSTVTVLPEAPVITATPDVLCVSGTSLITANPSTGFGIATFQWQSSSDNVTFSDISGQTNISLTTPDISNTSYFKMIMRNGATVCSETNVVTITVNNPSVTSTTPATRCGTGTVSLEATTGAESLAWYATETGGAPLGSGSPFVTPSISTTTNFYVAAGVSSPQDITIGAGASTSLNNDYKTPFCHYYGGFKAQYLVKASELIAAGNSAGFINSVSFDIVAATGLAFNSFNCGIGATTSEALTTTFQPISSSVYSAASVTPTVGINTYTFSTPFAWDGVSNIIIQTCWSNNNSGSSANTATAKFDVTSFASNSYFNADNKTASVVCGTATGTGTLSARPKMIFDGIGTCSGARVAVTATVTPAPALTITESQSLCNEAVGVLAVTSDVSNFDTYTWSPVTNLFTDIACTTPYVALASATTLYVKSATPSTTNYTCTANDLVSLCVNTATSTVTIQPVNPIPVVSTNLVIACQGSTSIPISTISGPQTITVQFDVLTQPVETNSAPGNIVASATIPAIPAGATITSASFSYPGISANGTSWRSDVKLGFSGAVVNDAASGTGALNSSGVFDYIRTIPAVAINNAGGLVNLLYWDSYSDETGADATFPIGAGVATLTINYSLAPATISWYDAATGGNLVGSNSPLQTVGTTLLPNTNTPDSYEFYAENSTNGCPSASRTLVTVTIIEAPLAPTASNQTICFGTATPDLTASGTGTIKWYSDASLSTLLYTGATFATGKTAVGTYTYYVTLSDVDCEGPATSVVLAINPIPAAPIANNQIVCTENIIPDLTAIGTGEIKWYSDAALLSLEATGETFATGETVAGVYTYYVTQTENACESPSAIATLTINATPTAPLAVSKSACFGTVIPDLTATGTGTIKWYSDASLSTLVYTGTPFTTGNTAAGTYTYYVTQTENGCESSATTVTLTIHELPTGFATVIGNNPICNGETAQIKFNFTGASLFNITVNNDLNTNIIPINAIADNYTIELTPSLTDNYNFLTLTDNNGCTVAINQTVTITVIQLPTAAVIASIDPTGCGLADGSISVTNNVNYSYNWSTTPVQTTSIATGLLAGNYSVTVSENGCDQVFSKTLSDPAGFTVALTSSDADNTICAGESVTFTPSGLTTGTYEFFVNGVSQGITTSYTTSSLTNGAEVYVIGNELGCIAQSNSVITTVHALPNVVAQASDLSICPTDAVTLTGLGASTYVWSGTVLNGVPFVPSATATYTVTGTDGFGCQKTATVQVVVNTLPNVLAIASSNSVCTGSPVTLTGQNAVSYVWSHGVVNGVAFVPSASATYSVTGTDVNGCVNTANVTVTLLDLPTVGATASATGICPNSPVTLNGTGAVNYTWNNAVVNNVAFTPTVTKTYTVTGTDANNCSNTATIEVAIYTPATVTINASSVSVCAGQGVTLSGAGAVSYLWNNSVVNGVEFVPTATSTYIVTGTDVNSCTNTASIQVVVKPLPIVVANASSTSIFAGQSVTLTGSGASTYEWSHSVVNGVAFNPTSTATYTVTGTNVSGCSNTASVAVAIVVNDQTDILTFKFNGLTPAVVGVVNATTHTVALTVPYGTNLTALVPTITLSTNATINPASGVANNFSSPVIYTVTAENTAITQDWTVNVTVLPNAEKDILTFNLTTPAVTGVIAGNKITLFLPAGTDITALVPTITVSPEATVSPASGIAQNFTTPKTYTVTAQNGTTKVYTVSVDVVQSVPYVQDFEATTFPPAYWLLDKGVGSGNHWTHSTTGGVTGSPGSMKCSYSSTLASNAWALTPYFSLENGKKYIIQFYQKAGSTSYSEKLKLTVGSDKTIASQTTVLWSNDTLKNSSFIKRVVPFECTANGNYVFGFNCYSIANQLSLTIDSICIYEMPMYDAGVVAMTSPALNTSLGSSAVSVDVKNFGVANITSTSVNWSVNGTIQTPFVFSNTGLVTNATENVTLGNYTFNIAGSNTLKFWTGDVNGNADANHNNDTLVRTIFVIPNYDAQAIAVNAPASSIFAGTQDVKVAVKNLGVETMNQVVINWSVNGVLQTPYTHTPATPLVQNASETQILIGNFSFTQMGSNTIKVWTGLINGNADQITANDTFTYVLAVKGFAPIPYAESFDGTWINGSSTRDIPSFYSNNTPATGNNSWRRDDDGLSAVWSSPTSYGYTPTGANGTLHSARFHSGYASSGTIGLMDHYLDFSTPGTKELSFYYINTSGNDSLEALISYDNGANFDKLAGYKVQSSWTKKSINLGNNTNSQVVVRFKATSDYGATDIGIDELKVRLMLAADVAVSAIQGPVSSACGLVNDTVKVTVSNSGLTDVTDLPLTLVVVGPNGSNTYPSIIPSLLVGQSTVVNAAIINTTESGVYKLTAFTNLSNDGDRNNDTMRIERTTSFPKPLPYFESFDSLTLDWTASGTAMSWGTGHGLTSKAIYKNLWSSGVTANAYSPKVGPITPGSFLVFDYRIVDYSTPYPATNITINDSIKVIMRTCDNAYLVHSITSTNHTPSGAMKKVVLPIDPFFNGTDVFAGFIVKWGAGDYYVDFDNVEIKMADPISVNIANAMICAGQTHTFIATDGDDYTYQWFQGSLSNPLTETTNQLNVTTAGNYYVIATNIFGLSDTAMATLTINALPVVNLGAAQIKCANEAIVLNAGTFDSYAWSTGDTTQIVSLDHADLGSGLTNVAVTVTDVNGCSNSGSVNITFIDIPVVDLGLDVLVCDGNPIVVTAPAGLTYLWNNSSTNQSITVSTAGTYSVVVTDPITMCQNTDSITVLFSPVVTVELGANINLCTGSAALLDAGYTIGGTYSWFEAANPTIVLGTSQTFSATAAGTYHVVVTNTCLSTATDFVTVTLIPIPTAVISGTASICEGQSGTLAVNLTGVAPWNVVVFDGNNSVNHNGINTSSVEFTVHPITNTTYTVSTVTDANGCSNVGTGSAVIVVNAAPIVDLGLSEAICAGETRILDAGVHTSYLWSDNSTNQTLTVSAEGTYSVTVTNANGCTATDNYVLTVNSLPVINIPTNAGVCLGSTLTLDAGNTGSTFLWNTNATTQTINVIAADTYSVVVTDANGCSNTASVDVVVNSLPVVNLGPNATLCFNLNETLQLDAGNVGSTYAWSVPGLTGQTPIVNNTLLPLGVTTVSVTVTDANTCQNTGSIVITYEICSGVSEIGPLSSMNIYPNPTKGNLNINFGNTIDQAVIELIGMNGQLISREEVKGVSLHTLDLGKIAKGIYSIRIISENQTVVGRVVVN